MTEELHYGTGRFGRGRSLLQKQMRENALKKKRQTVERHVRNHQVALTHTPPRSDTA